MTESFDDLRIVQRTDGGPPIEASIEDREDDTRIGPFEVRSSSSNDADTDLAPVPCGMNRTPRQVNMERCRRIERVADRLFKGRRRFSI
jgi:hypothetical protein